MTHDLIAITGLKLPRKLTNLPPHNATRTMTFNLYPKIIHERDLSPDAVGPEIEEACKEIHEACKGFGTNEG